MDVLTLENGARTLCRNVGSKLPVFALQREDGDYTAVESKSFAYLIMRLEFQAG